jgi:hypothetical protein
MCTVSIFCSLTYIPLLCVISAIMCLKRFPNLTWARRLSLLAHSSPCFPPGPADNMCHGVICKGTHTQLRTLRAHRGPACSDHQVPSTMLSKLFPMMRFGATAGYKNPQEKKTGRDPLLATHHPSDETAWSAFPSPHSSSPLRPHTHTFSRPRALSPSAARTRAQSTRRLRPH